MYVLIMAHFVTTQPKWTVLEKEGVIFFLQFTEIRT